MTDTRKEFKKWWNIENKNPIPDYGQESLTYDIAFHGWQACQSLNDKRIEQLLAVIEVQRDALQKLYDTQNGCPLPKYEHDWNEAMRLTNDALAIKPENVELVEVEDYALVNGALPIGIKLYAIKTKGGNDANFG